MKQYLDLLRHIKDNGTHKPAAREGMPGTKSIFGYQFRHNLADGFPLLTTKKMFWKGIVVELLWFLRGDTNIKYLLDNGVGIWNEDAYNYYIKMTKKSAVLNVLSFQKFIEIVKERGGRVENYENYVIGDCGHQYGKVWRRWSTGVTKIDLQSVDFDKTFQPVVIDQIQNLITSFKNTPESRRHILTAIDPAHDQDLALYWCHAMVQFNCRPLSTYDRYKWAKFNIGQHLIDSYHSRMRDRLNELGVPKYHLDCQLYQRSADAVLGVPFNIASYALLTHILAEICNMVPGEFVHTFGDVHIYDNHAEAVEEQLGREPRGLPNLVIDDRIKANLSKDGLDFTLSELGETTEPSLFFKLFGYTPYSALENKPELSTGLKK